MIEPNQISQKNSSSSSSEAGGSKNSQSSQIQTNNNEDEDSDNKNLKVKSSLFIEVNPNDNTKMIKDEYSSCLEINDSEISQSPRFLPISNNNNNDLFPHEENDINLQTGTEASVPFISHHKCRKCGTDIPDSSSRYGFLYYKDRSYSEKEKDCCFDCFDVLTNRSSNYKCEFFEVSFLPSHYSCSKCDCSISDKVGRFHYCLSDDGNINLCVECFWKLQKEYENNDNIINDKENYINNFIDPFHFHSKSCSYLYCEPSYPYKRKPTKYLYGDDFKGEKKIMKPETIVVFGYVDGERCSKTLPITSLIGEMMKLFLEDKKEDEYCVLDFQSCIPLNNKHTIEQCGVGGSSEIQIVPISQVLYFVYQRFDNVNRFPRIALDTDTKKLLEILKYY
jgi:hypothetical protein